MVIRAAAAVLLSLILSACSGGESPTGPSSVANAPSVAASSRVINVAGNLAFGDVTLGASRESTMTITNSGTAPLTVSSLTVTGGLAAHVTATWTSGTIPAGSSQNVVVRFRPASAGAFSGSVIVNGDQTSGNNAVAISGSSLVSFAGTWTGSHRSTACNGTGSAQDLICGATRGAYKVGSTLHFSVTLTQNGNTVAGTANIGGPSGPVTGTVNGNTLTLTGTLRDNQGFTSVITAWNTTVSGSVMTGAVGYSLSYSGLPGNAGIEASLSNVTKR